MSTTDPGTEVITEGTYDTYQGCILYDKANTFVIPGGAPETIIWQFRDDSGNPIDISKYFPDADPNSGVNGVFIWISSADQCMIWNKPIPAIILDASTGKIQFDLPPAIYFKSCIYEFRASIAAKDKPFLPLYMSRNVGVILIEWTPILQIRNPKCCKVMPTLLDIRRKLDDFVGKNTLTEEVEYSSDDIVNAMIWPVRQFNEHPPELVRYRFNTCTFPYYEHWIIGTAAELLDRSINHFVRNKLQSSHGGITGDEKNRDKDYAQIAERYKQEFMLWTAKKKRELNYDMGQGFGNGLSDYTWIG